METQEKIVNRYVEKPVKTKNGFAMLALILLLFFGSIAAMVCGPVFLSATNVGAAVAIAIAGALVLIFDLFLMPGLKILNPNEALVLTLFGKYHGTLKKDGYFWVNPFCEGINPGAQGSSMTTNLNGSTTVSLGGNKKISLKTMTLNNEKQTVNDERGTPSSSAPLSSGALWTPPRRCLTCRTTAPSSPPSAIPPHGTSPGCTPTICWRRTAATRRRCGAAARRLPT